MLLFNALAPMMFAAIVEAWGYRTGTYILFVLALLSAVAMEGMAVWYRRHLARTATSANTATGSHA